MITYRKDLARKHWHRPWPVRIGLVVVGLVLLLAGSLGWSLETEYGGDPDRPEYTIAQDEVAGTVMVIGEGGDVLYESSDLEDAVAFSESTRGSRNYTVPSLVYAGAALLLIAGVSPSPTTRAPTAE